MRRIGGIGLGLALMASSALAQQLPGAPPPPPAAKVEVPKPAETIVPQKRTTRHSGTFGGQRMTYSASIGETILKADAKYHTPLLPDFELDVAAVFAAARAA